MDITFLAGIALAVLGAAAAPFAVFWAREWATDRQRKIAAGLAQAAFVTVEAFSKSTETELDDKFAIVLGGLAGALQKTAPSPADKRKAGLALVSAALKRPLKPHEEDAARHEFIRLSR